MAPTIIDDAVADGRLMDEGEHRAIAIDKQSGIDSELMELTILRHGQTV